MSIEYLIFDLDNTLYPSSAQMDKGITTRMMNCVAEFFNTSYEEAVKIRAEHITNFSTTLEWLRSEGLTDIETYFSKVHPQNEADELQPDTKLRPFLEAISLPKIILTNAPREHAQRVLDKLQIADLFIDICDIRSSNFYGKPYPLSFEIALQKIGGTIKNSLFIDDMQKYVDGYTTLGGTAVLVGNKNGKPLEKDAKPMQAIQNKKQGTLYKIQNIYELTDLLDKLNKNATK